MHVGLFDVIVTPARHKKSTYAYDLPCCRQALPDFYKGPIRFEENRKVWSSAKISMNFHVVDGYGGWYANQRNTEILASRGLLVVDRAPEGRRGELMLEPLHNMAHPWIGLSQRACIQTCPLPVPQARCSTGKSVSSGRVWRLATL
jgi:hypothetical protein